MASGEQTGVDLISDIKQMHREGNACPLGVSSDTVYRWIDKHSMPAHRMGRLWKFKKDEVDEWVKAGGAADKTR